MLNFLTDCRISRIACYAFLGAGFLAFFVSLDRYPQIYPDDSFYNYPAISYLEGKGFKYKVDGAPHGDAIFAYHGPIFPHLQVAVFRAFGASQFTFRATQYVSGYLAVAALCSFLIARRLPLAAIIVAAAWLGDRSSQEVMLGRMEGLALLFLSGAFIGLVKSVEFPSIRNASLCGACSLGAAAVHPVAAVFTFIAFACLAVLLRGSDRKRAIAGFSLGALATMMLVIWLWSPDIVGSFEQLYWTLTRAGFAAPSSRDGRISHLWRVLGWAKYWTLVLAVVSVAALLPVSLAEACKSRFTIQSPGNRSIIVLATCFAMAGLVCVSRGGQSYYLVYFTVWPVVAFAVIVDAAISAKGRSFWIPWAAALVMAAWTPSLLWNCLRLRESILYREQLAQERFTSQLAAIIPKNARVISIPELLIVGKEAGLHISPTPWHEERVTVDSRAWLLVKEAELVDPHWFAAESITSRKVLFKGDAFPGIPVLGYRFAILGPADGSADLVSALDGG